MSVIIYNPLRDLFPNAKHVCQFFMSLSNIIVKHAIKDQKGILFKYVDSYKLCKVATMWVRCPLPRFAQGRSLLLCGSHLYFCSLLKIYLSKFFGLHASNWHHSIKRPIRTSLFQLPFSCPIWRSQICPVSNATIATCRVEPTTTQLTQSPPPAV